MTMRTTLTSNQYHSKYVWFLSISYFRKILEWLESFTVLVVVAFTENKKKSYTNKKDRAASWVNTQRSGK